MKAPHTPEQVEQATRMLVLYRTLRLLQLMDESGIRTWKDDITCDELGGMLTLDARELGLEPGDAASDEAVQRFIAFRMNTLATQPYDEYLQSPEWQDVRYFALRKAERRCQTCNRAGRLHVHHRTYEHRGYERLVDVTVLCADCHEAFHQNRGLARR